LQNKHGQKYENKHQGKKSEHITLEISWPISMD